MPRILYKVQQTNTWLLWVNSININSNHSTDCLCFWV